MRRKINLSEEYVIHNEDELYKQLYRLRKLNEEQAKDDEQYNKEIAESQAWYEPAKQKRQAAIDNVKSLIEEFYINQYQKDPYYRYKSRNGSVSKRETTTFVHDDNELLKTVPDKYVKRSIKWGDFKKTLRDTGNGTVVDADGEIVKGVKAEKSLNVIIKPTKGE